MIDGLYMWLNGLGFRCLGVLGFGGLGVWGFRGLGVDGLGLSGSGSMV